MWNPWNWVKAGWDFSFGSIKQLYQWVLNTIGSIYDYVNGWIQWLENAISNAVSYAYHLAVSIENWAQSVFNNVIGWAQRTFADFSRWVSGLWNQLYQLIKEGWDFAHWVYNYLYNLVSGWINDVYKWVVRNVWDPLYNWVTGIYKNLTQWINYILQFIEHPELLATLIGTYLLKVWLTLAKRFAVPLARWWMRTMMSLAGEFIDIIESIISQVL